MYTREGDCATTYEVRTDLGRCGEIATSRYRPLLGSWNFGIATLVKGDETGPG